MCSRSSPRSASIRSAPALTISRSTYRSKTTNMAGLSGKRISRGSELFVVFAWVLEPDGFHDMVRERGSVDGFREATVVDHLQVRLTSEVRRRSDRVFEQIDIDRHANAGCHDKTIRCVEARRHCDANGQRFFKALVD